MRRFFIELLKHLYVIMKIHYKETAAFQKDLKKLLKKFRTLTEDLETAKKNALELFHLRKIDNKSVFPVPNFYNSDFQIYKLKKFACKSLKGRGVKSGIRVIYAFFPKEMKIIFIEIYFKANKPNMDYERAENFLKTITL